MADENNKQDIYLPPTAIVPGAEGGVTLSTQSGQDTTQETPPPSTSSPPPDQSGKGTKDIPDDSGKIDAKENPPAPPREVAEDIPITEDISISQEQQNTNTQWLQTNPPPDPMVDPVAYKSWLESKPFKTDADKNQLDILNKFGTIDVPAQTIQQSFQRVQVVNAEGKLQWVNLDVEAYMEAIAKPPGADQLDALVKLGVLPQGTEIISDVDGFNERFGTNIDEDWPYALPYLVDYVTGTVRTEGSLQLLINNGLATEENGIVTLEPDVFSRALDNTVIKRALKELYDITDEEIAKQAESYRIQARLKDIGVVEEDGTLNINQAIERGITYEELRDAGYQLNEAEYNKLKEQIERLKSTFEPYKSEEGYDTEKLLNAYNNGEVSSDDLASYFGEGIIKTLDEVNKASKNIKESANNEINKFAEDNNIGINNTDDMSVEEIKSLILAGLDPKILVLQGQDETKINQAVDEINQRYDEYQDAIAQLGVAGFIDRGRIDASVEDIARWQRENPEDTNTIPLVFGDSLYSQIQQYNDDLKTAVQQVEDYLSIDDDRFGSEGYAINNAIIDSKIKVPPLIGRYGYDKLIGKYYDATTEQVLSEKDLLRIHWNDLSDAEKEVVAQLFAKDPTKGNYFAAAEGLYERIAREGGLAAQLTTAPILPITHVIAKQITIDEARELLKKEYAREIESISEYINNDGTVDINSLKSRLEIDEAYKEQILKETGYDKDEDLISNLDYYNNGLKVTTEEWATAGAVAALDILMLGGAGALAKLGLGGRLVSGAVQVSSAGIFAPGAIRAIRSPKVSIGEKVLIGAIPLLLITGGILTVKPVPLSKLSPIGKVTKPAIEQSSVTVWRGIKLGDNPLVGISRGGVSVGRRGIRLPPVKEWELGGLEGRTFRPETGLERRVLVNEQALAKAGVKESSEFVGQIEKTLSEVEKFNAKKSPTMNSDLMANAIDTLDAEGVSAVLRQVVEDNKIVDVVYGSSTIRPQLKLSEMQAWLESRGKPPGDFDIMASKGATAEQIEAFVRRTVDRINRDSDWKVQINPEKPTQIMSRSLRTGEPKKALEVHQEGEIPDDLSANVGEMAYGYKLRNPAIKINIKGVGEFEIVRLSDTGMGKMSSVLEWRTDPLTGEVVLRAAAHRAKDYVDLYYIIKKFNGEKAADAWAEKMGFDLAEFKKIVADSPEPIFGLRKYTPAQDATSASIGEYSPIVTLESKALISASQSIPIGLASSGAIVAVASSNYPPLPSEGASETLAEYSSQYVSPSQQESAYAVPSESPSVFASESPISGVVESPSLGIESPVPESPSPLSPVPESPSPISGIPSTSVPPSSVPPYNPAPISPSPSVPPPSPSPYPFVPPPEPGVPPPEQGLLRVKNKQGEDEDLKIQPGTLVWIQGHPEGGAMYKLIMPPYNDDTKYTSRDVPPGYRDEGWTGKGSAFKSVQVIGGNPPTNIENVDLGFVKVNATFESGEPKIEFVHDKDANVGRYTVGMGENQIPIEEWKNAKAEGIGYEEFINQYKSGERKLDNMEEEPVSKLEQEMETYINGNGRIRKPFKNLKNWWDEGLYENYTSEPLVQGRYYRGRRLLSPNIGEEL